MGTGLRGRVARSFLRVVLRLYPRDFLREHGASLQQSYTGLLEGRGVTLRQMAWLLWDAAVTSVRLRWYARRNDAQTRDGRGRKGWMMGGWMKELVFAARSLGRAPLFMIAVVLTMGLGIGANTAVFTVVYGAFFRPLAYESPEELVWVENRYLPGGSTGAVSGAEFWELREEPSVRMAAMATSEANLTSTDVPLRLRGLAVTPGYFQLLGRGPALGRAFVAGEDDPGRGSVVVLSHGLWQTAFGGDATVVGRTIELGGSGVTVVGVMGSEYESLAEALFPGRDNDYWTPYTLDPSGFNARTVELHNLRVIGRLAAGVDGAAVERGLLDDVQRIEQLYPGISNAGSRDVRISPLRDRLVGDTGRLLTLLALSASLVFILACVNVTGMLASRSEARSTELGVRVALGASRGRLLANGSAESLVIGAVGGLVGLALAALALGGAGAAGLVAVDQAGSVGPGVLLFSMVFAALAASLAGAPLALRISRGGVSAVLRSGSGGTARGGTGNRMRTGLVLIQVAGTVVLASSAALILRSLHTLRSVDPGFESADVLLVSVNATREAYPTLEAVRRLHDDLQVRLEALPGVESVTGSWQTPLQAGMSDWPVMAEAPEPEWVGADPNWVTPSYFDTYGIELVAGRLFDRSDLDLPLGPVVISESAARALWADGAAVGRRVNVDFPGPVWREVIGVVRDVRIRGLDQAARPQTYLTFAPGPFGPNPNLTLTARTSLGEEAFRQALSDVLGRIDPDIPIGAVSSMDSQVASSLTQQRLLSWVLTVFGGLAMLLGTVGVYGVVAYSVERRRREIGLRIAVGAERLSVLRLLLRQGAVIGVAGVGIGLVAAFVSARVLEGFLFEVSSTDPATLAGVAVSVLLVTLLATYAPAARAARLDPLTALRSE